MTQMQWIILCFKVIDVAALVTIAAFVAYYTKLAPWYRNVIGRTIVLKDIALILVLIPSVLSLFMHFGRTTSLVVGWYDVTSFAMVPVIMVWRIAVWHKIHKAGMLHRDDGSDDGNRTEGGKT